MNKQMSPIEYMARLQIAARNSTLAGRRVDPRVMSEINRLETFARATFTPAQMANAGRMVEQAKLRIMETMNQREAQQVHENVGRRVGNTVAELTRGMLGQQNGLTHDQLRALSRGEKVHIPKPTRETQSQRDTRYRAATRSLDPNRRGWDEAEATRHMDAIADATPQQLRHMAAEYGTTPEALRQIATSWREDRITHGVERKRDARFRENEDTRPTPVTSMEPSEGTRRRAAIVSAYLDHTANEIEEDHREGRYSEVAGEFNEDISPALKNESFNGQLTRRAQIARAFESSEED